MGVHLTQSETSPPMPETVSPPTLAAIAIGRNEGVRLAACLAALKGEVGRIVYVDSGSTDDSVAIARAAGAEVVDLDLSVPFTAARARNAGIDALAGQAGRFQGAPARDPERAPRPSPGGSTPPGDGPPQAGAPPDLVQFVDGDCEIQPGWIATARAFLETTPEAAVACGRRRERFPEASVYNRLCDAEWDTPVGRATACGGDALMRWSAVAEVGGFNPAIIAGEEPDLCVRLRSAGWEIWRLDAEMTLHDAAMTRFVQWWRRTRRAGHAFAEGAHRHGHLPERFWVAETRRALLWGTALPVAAFAGALVSPWTLLLLLAYPAQILRLARRAGGDRFAAEQALFLVLGKIPESLGVLEFHGRRLFGRPSGLIEYK